MKRAMFSGSTYEGSRNLVVSQFVRPCKVNLRGSFERLLECGLKSFNFQSQFAVSYSIEEAVTFLPLDMNELSKKKYSSSN